MKHTYDKNNDHSFEDTIPQYDLKESYTLDEKDDAVLTASQLTAPGACCYGGEYTRTIEIWNENSKGDF